MSPFFFFVQLLNAVQYGLILYLVASGLTLLLGIMGVINLAHGAFYMVGAYMAFAVVQHLASFWLALPLAIVLGLALGALLERFLLSRLEGADHLSQVLLSFGLILIINEGQRIIFGNDPHGIDVPRALNFSIPLSDTFAYPAYRLFVCAIGIAFAVGVSLVMARTRIGMMLRASAENRPMARALGVNAKRMYLGVTAAGIACAVLAGVIAAPIASVYPGMGDQVLIQSFVVIVLGGIGSLPGALVGAMLLGLVDAFGKQFFPNFAAFLVYAAMIAVLIARPQGLFRGTGT
ncbi:MAG: branched-chain amino acid ABC transporter permease [Xanthobacteraceae bacterium]|jgi:branched-chain amino acid transport system permease protein